jgi:hypothetical protein
VQVAPGSLLRISAALGPLQELGVSGALSFQIAPLDSPALAQGKPGAKGATLTMTYAVGGYVPGGFEKLAPLVDSVMTHQVQLLKQHLEKVGR